MDEKFLRAYLDEFSKVPGFGFWRACEASLLSSFRYKTPILDLGCGDGFFGSLLIKDYGDTFGVDISKQEIQKAKKRACYRECGVADASHLPFEDCFFRTVISNCVIEHIDGLKEAVQEINRVLTSDGIFIFTIPSPNFGRYLIGYQLLKLFNKKLAKKYSKLGNNNAKHVNLYPANVWRNLLKRRGFETVEIYGYMTKKDILFWDFWHSRFITKILSIIPKNIQKSIIRKLLYTVYKRYPLTINPDESGALLIVACKGKEYPEKTRLNLGCGTNINPLFLNLDIANLEGVDVVHNLDNFPWPFDNNKFKEIRMIHVLEHLSNPLKVMEELYRISQSDAKITIRVPYWNSFHALRDPTHKRGFHYESFDFYDPGKVICQRRPYYTNARFKIKKKIYWTKFLGRERKIEFRLMKWFLERASNYICSVIIHMEVQLQAIKD